MAAGPDNVGSENSDATSPTTLYSDDIANRLESTTDSAGNRRDYSYDDLDRKIQEQTHVYLDPSHLNQEVTRQYRYDEVGNLRRVFDRNDRERTIDHDARNNMTSESWDNGRTFTFHFDDADRLESSTDSAGPSFD